MLIGVTVVLGLVSTSLAAQTCLSNNRFTANSVQTIASLDSGSTTPDILDAMNTIDYDADLMMIALHASRYHADTGLSNNYTLIQDFKNHKMYTLSPGYCNEEQFDAPFFGPCIPANMTQTGSYTVAGGQETVNVFTGNLLGTMYHIHVTDSGELFAYINYGQGPAGDYQMETQLFVNVRMGVLSDPNVFNNVGCHGQGSPIGR